jgi:hypothetical protein
MKSLILTILSVFSVWSQPEPIHFQVEGREPASQERIEACNKAVESFAVQYGDQEHRTHWMSNHLHRATRRV